MTAWTRDDWAALARRMLLAVEPYRSPLGARVDLPGPNSRSGAASDGLEGFARTFLLAGFLVAGNDGDDPDGWLERYALGLAAGTDPGSPEAWPRPDELPQAKVEAASIALILQLTRPWLWDRLTDPVRERVVDWLATVIGQPYPPINWVWFRIVVESFLREVGGPWSPADIESDLAVHAGMRRPDGWLSDGPERAYDHYVGWALHLYPLLWTHLFDVTELVSSRVRTEWAADLARYLDDAVRLVGADGSPLMQGRSLTYRFAAAAPFWVAALTGTGGLAPGLIRRVTTGMVRHFVTGGALGSDGILSLGWRREWPALRQIYSGPASPYWAAKGMLGLVLPAHHPVWTEPEAPLPVEIGDEQRSVTAPGWLLSARRDDGFAVVLNHGTDHAQPGDQRSDSPLYARLGYSTVTMPPSSGWRRPLDNTVTVLDVDERPSHRAGFRTLFVDERPGGVLLAASSGPVRWVDIDDADSPDHGSGRAGEVTPGPVLTVASVLRGGTEVRLCRVDALAPDDRWRTLRLGGWPVSGDHKPLLENDSCVRVGRLRSELRPLLGFTRGGVVVERDVTPLGVWTATPWLAVAEPIPLGEILAAVVVLGHGSPAPRLHVVSDQVELVWPDDHRITLFLPEFGGAQCP